MDDAGLAELLCKVRSKNESLGVSGMLLFHQGSFIQVLEGPEETVDELFELIKEDPRHTKVALVLRQEVDERDFADWSMGFVSSSTLKDLPGYQDYIDAVGTVESMAGDRSRALKVLSQFRDGRWRQTIEG